MVIPTAFQISPLLTSGCRAWEVRLRPNGIRPAGAPGCGQQQGGRVRRVMASADGETITVHIPLIFGCAAGESCGDAKRRRVAPRPRVDNAMVKALARAFGWRKMLDAGVYSTINDLAKAKAVNATYVSRILRLTLLSPEIVGGPSARGRGRRASPAPSDRAGSGSARGGTTGAGPPASRSAGARCQRSIGW